MIRKCLLGCRNVLEPISEGPILDKIEQLQCSGLTELAICDIENDDALCVALVETKVTRDDCEANKAF